MNGNEVNAAFDILLKEIEHVVDSLKDEGAAALKAGDFSSAQRAAEKAKQLYEFQGKVKALQREWISLETRRQPYLMKVRRSNSGRLPRGLRTPEEAFRRPILEALVELGGRASASLVLDRVGRKMANVLTQHDRQPLPSRKDEMRWQNSARWCRNTLVSEGLLKSGSPKGIWEISEAGRKFLTQQEQ
jgi:hypothetical protein